MAIENNLFEIFRQRFPLDRKTPFMLDEKGNVISYADMEKQSAKIANYFVSLGLKKGDRIAVQVHKSPQALLIYIASLRAGLIFLPLNTAYLEQELAYFFSDANPSLVICDPEKKSIIQTILQAEKLPALIDTLDVNGQGSLIYQAQRHSGYFETVTCEPDDLVAILYTSGTTGKPKGAMLSHANLASNALVLQDAWGWRQDDVLLHVLPIFHVHGLFVACHCVMAAGASMIFLPKFDVEQVKHKLSKSTVMMGVPTYYNRLLADDSFGNEHCRNMRLFISGSAPLLAVTHQQFEQRAGHRILERYGMSETSMLISNPLHGERRAGTVGQPLPGIEVRIVDKTKNSVAIDRVGSIEVRGANVFQGYWKMPEKTAQEFTDDGFFITGDQGKISEDGYISIVGRAKDMIITGGYNVYPKEVESVLDDMSGVKETAVIGLPHSDYGEAVIAIIVADQNTQLDEVNIITQAKQKMASYKVPKAIYFVSALPRNTMGKVQKNILRGQFSEYASN